MKPLSTTSSFFVLGIKVERKCLREFLTYDLGLLFGKPS